MSKAANTTTRLNILAIGIALIQIFDILIHAATDQLEFLRVTSNIVILLWLAFVFFGKANTNTAIGAVGLYLLLNIIFLAREGLTNPQQGGELRVMLFILVILTTVLSIILALKYPEN